MKKQIALLLIMATFFLFSCNPENKEWKIAKKENTVKSYSNFVNKYPEHQHQDDLKLALTDLIMAAEAHYSVLYDNFRLRSKPDLDGELLLKMPINSEVEILEKSNTTEEIEIAGHKANSYWYKVKIDGTSGWAFGAGLGCSSEIYDACNFYLELFPDENLEKFKN